MYQVRDLILLAFLAVRHSNCYLLHQLKYHLYIIALEAIHCLA